MKIYCAHAISGRSAKEVLAYYDEVNKKLTTMGFTVLHPMVGKGYMRTEVKFKAEGYGNPLASNHAIKERDKWMAVSADVIYINLLGTKTPSIGCIAELAWGDLLGKHTVLCMEKDNIHRHAFMLEMADIIFETEEDTLEYLKKLISREI
jgi:hypothetical protein